MDPNADAKTAKYSSEVFIIQRKNKSRLTLDENKSKHQESQNPKKQTNWTVQQKNKKIQTRKSKQKDERRLQEHKQIEGAQQNKDRLTRETFTNS